MTGSIEGPKGGTSGGGVTAQGRPEAKGVNLDFPICCCADPKGW